MGLYRDLRRTHIIVVRHGEKVLLTDGDGLKLASEAAQETLKCQRISGKACLKYCHTLHKNCCKSGMVMLCLGEFNILAMATGNWKISPSLAVTRSIGQVRGGWKLVISDARSRN